MCSARSVSSVTGAYSLHTSFTVLRYTQTIRYICMIQLGISSASTRQSLAETWAGQYWMWCSGELPLVCIPLYILVLINFSSFAVLISTGLHTPHGLPVVSVLVPMFPMVFCWCTCDRLCRVWIHLLSLLLSFPPCVCIRVLSKCVQCARRRRETLFARPETRH